MLKLEELKEMHDKAYNTPYDTRLKAADDLLFAWISQWDDTYLAESDLSYRGEFNILRKAMRQITTDLISNPVQVDFEPIDETVDDGADLLDGMYRADMRNNTSLEAKKNCNQEAIVCGYGAWEMRTEYKTNRKGDERQVVKRYPLYEANNNVMWDPNAKLLDKSDADYVSCLIAYSEDGYQKLKEELTGDDSGYDSSFASPEVSYVFPWISEQKKIYVTRFYHREKIDVTYLTYADDYNNDTIVDQRELSDYEEELAERGAKLVDEKTVTRYEVTLYIASGEDILSAEVIPGEHIPVIPQYGERQFVEGEEHYEGIVRLAKDPQRLRNFQMSYLADIVSRSPREKPMFTAEQLQGFEDMYEDSGAENNYPYLKQQSFDGSGRELPLGPVGYIKAPEIPPALQQMLGETRLAVDDVAGAGLPADITDVELSGKALNSLNKRLDMQSFTYQDNHKFATRRDGEIYASMVKDIKDIEEEVVLVKADNSSSKETLNKVDYEFTDQGVKEVIKNNMKEMDFEVYADIGPAFESVKAQNKEELKELLNGMDQGTPLYSILLNKYVMMIDGVSFDDVRDYARQELIMMGVQEPETDEEKQKLQQAQEAQEQQQDPSMVLAQAEMLKGQADLLEQQNRQAEIQLQANKVQLDAQGKREKLDSETNLNIAKVQQERQKIDLDAKDKFIKNAIAIAELEFASQQEQNANIRENMNISQ